MGICEGLSRVSWKLSCTVLRGGITGNGDSLLDKAIKGQKAKQPYAIAMKDGSPFGLGGLWENWKEPASDEWIRTFAVITTGANELVAELHDRMPLILAPGDYARWLSDEPDPHELMRPFPAGSMRMWAISTRVNEPENDDPSIVEPIELAISAA